MRCLQPLGSAGLRYVHSETQVDVHTHIHNVLSFTYLDRLILDICVCVCARVCVVPQQGEFNESPTQLFAHC